MIVESLFKIYGVVPLNIYKILSLFIVVVKIAYNVIYNPPVLREVAVIYFVSSYKSLTFT